MDARKLTTATQGMAAAKASAFARAGLIDFHKPTIHGKGTPRSAGPSRGSQPDYASSPLHRENTPVFSAGTGIDFGRGSALDFSRMNSASFGLNDNHLDFRGKFPGARILRR